MNEKEVKSSETTIIESTTEGVHTLTIKSVKEVHTSEVKCVATNVKGKAETKSKLKVKSKPL